jgi:hypothetical protein
MAVITETPYLSDLVKYEEDCLAYSRNQETVAAGQNLGIGVVVARRSADGKLYALDPAAGDGTEVALGILIESVDATLMDKPALIVARHAIVADRAVIWPSGITGPQKAAAIAQLESRGILLRSAA